MAKEIKKELTEKEELAILRKEKAIADKKEAEKPVQKISYGKHQQEIWKIVKGMKDAKDGYACGMLTVNGLFDWNKAHDFKTTIAHPDHGMPVQVAVTPGTPFEAYGVIYENLKAGYAKLEYRPDPKTGEPVEHKEPLFTLSFEPIMISKEEDAKNFKDAGLTKED